MHEYLNDQRRKRFNLNKEQTFSPAAVSRITGQNTLLDALSKIQREDVERDLLYNQIIEKHNQAERRMFLYKNP